VAPWWAADGIGYRDIGIVPVHPMGLEKVWWSTIESTVKSIKKPYDMAENASGYNIKSVYAGIAAPYPRPNSLGIVQVKEREIDEEDMEKGYEAGGKRP